MFEKLREAISSSSELQIILLGAFVAFCLHFLGYIVALVTDQRRYLEDSVFAGSIIFFLFLAVAIWRSFARRR